ncbi:hypothetical protein DFR86_04535 [Acidianus sulfidivorans JP7]|uniref:Uncharacterized protein n=1 Tax=Acidianus sulfidivorans JP7 TaxID=619593 RepID=A0A2U9ILM2_9CREN|nr:hypothetical protein [Acidianus sulfidivorans]AWR96895.1 hypothetical protein DFR86_04535 [Acidianus sulfidivorans JP7]
MTEEIIQEPISKKELLFSFIVILISLVISVLDKLVLIFIVSTVLYSIPLFFYRFFYIVKMFNQKSNKISIIPRLRYERSRAFRSLLLVFLFLLLPFALLYILPTSLWITETLSIISSWLFSSLLGWILISRIEKETGGKLVRYYIIDEKLGEVLVTEYGYKIENN